MTPAADITTGTAAGIAYWRRPGSGAGPESSLPLVCLHGIGSRADSFRPMLDSLPADRNVIAWNAPGYGGSDPLPMDWPVEADYAAALARFLDALGLEQVDLLGHSLGTLIAARFVADHPERVGRLVLAACACGHGAEPGHLSDAAAKRIEDLETQGARAFAEARGPRLLARPDERPEARAAVVDAMAAVTMPGYGQAVRMLASGQLEQSLARVTAPASILWGAGDVVTPRAQSDRAAAALGGVEITELPETGHALHVETPGAFARALTKALEATAPAARQKERLT